MKRVINERTLRTAAALGVDSSLGRRVSAEREAALATAASRLAGELRHGSIAIVTGPSGAGKSTLLRLLAREPGAVTARPLTRVQMRMRVADLNARTPLASWAGLLARFGLAEARLLLTRAGDLSAGERARLEVALAAARCERRFARPRPGSREPTGVHAAPALLIIDEWCSVLDRPTAISVAIGAARWARQRGVRLIGATAHDDLATAVEADVTVGLDEQGGVRWTRCGLRKAG